MYNLLLLFVGSWVFLLFRIFLVIALFKVCLSPLAMALYALDQTTTWFHVIPLLILAAFTISLGIRVCIVHIMALIKDLVGDHQLSLGEINRLMKERGLNFLITMFLFLAISIIILGSVVIF